MINSRHIWQLTPEVRHLAQELINACVEEGIELIITSTYRDFEAQDALYAIGRTKPGRRVTNARGGRSFHNFRVAFDVVPVVGGKAVWNDFDLWKKIGALGVALGLEWAGNWKRFKEMPHFQYTGGRSLADFNKQEKKAK